MTGEKRCSSPILRGSHRLLLCGDGGHSPLLNGDEGTQGSPHLEVIGKSHDAKINVKIPSPRGRDSKVGRLYQADNSYLCGDAETQGSPRLEIWQTIRRQNEDKVKYPPRSCGKGLQTTPLHTGEDAVVAEERGVQMRVADFRTDGAIASPGSENMEPAEPTKARRRAVAEAGAVCLEEQSSENKMRSCRLTRPLNYLSVKEIQDKG